MEIQVTTVELSKLIGRAGLLAVSLDGGDLKIPVTVIDAKRAYGNTRLKISPAGGTGTAWVDSARVQFKGDQK